MFEAYGLSDPGCVRPNNEDYYLLAPSLGLFLVADGMGGAQAGEHASQLAAETVGEVVWRSTDLSTPDVLITALQEANRRVLTAASADTNLEGMGTTLTAVLDTGQQAYVASVGDSRAYIYHEGRLLIITEDQTWVQEVGKKLGIEEAQLKTHPMRHVLTMAIGVSDQLRINSYVVDLNDGMQFLLCSDGLHGVVGDEGIAEIFANNDNLEVKGRNLIERARAAGGPDNITAVLLRVVGSPGQLQEPVEQTQ
ncbi:MAG TPA: PP2C family serine/threonine-protein phosphatase [Bryobacteraceae bacterium]|nr:PP2C family serine/threonine-protein phosphatase [Bryobacteraceae bacterium]